jgi:hemolysin activation/secretion protein
MRYTVPLISIGNYHHELTVGFDYKSSNNNLEFTESGTATPVAKTFVDVMQLQLGYTATLPDKWGQTRFIGEAYVSPGGLTDHNKTDAFGALRLGADAQYEYGRLSLERVTRLPADFSWLARATGQLASGRLLPSEEMGFGGSSIRGYYTRTESGDEGVIVNDELRTPPVSLFGLTNRMFGHAAAQRPVDQFQVLGFFDYGASTVLDWQSNADNGGRMLYSVGAGLRYTISTYLSAEFDYGWELKRIPASQGAPASPGSQASVSVQVSY